MWEQQKLSVYNQDILPVLHNTDTLLQQVSTVHITECKEYLQTAEGEVKFYGTNVLGDIYSIAKLSIYAGALP